jgi:hypothetical protein
LERIAPVALGVRPPLVGSPVAAGGEQAVQDGQEDRPLDVALETASLQELLEDVLAPGLLPETLEDEGGSEASGGEGRELSLSGPFQK